METLAATPSDEAIDRDAEGFLRRPDQWTEELARQLGLSPAALRMRGPILL